MIFRSDWKFLWLNLSCVTYTQIALDFCTYSGAIRIITECRIIKKVKQPGINVVNGWLFYVNVFIGNAHTDIIKLIMQYSAVTPSHCYWHIDQLTITSHMKCRRCQTLYARGPLFTKWTEVLRKKYVSIDTINLTIHFIFAWKEKQFTILSGLDTKIFRIRYLE